MSKYRKGFGFHKLLSKLREALLFVAGMHMILVRHNPASYTLHSLYTTYQ